MLTAMRSHESAVQNNEHVLFTGKITQRYLVSLEILQGKIGCLCIHIDFGHRVLLCSLFIPDPG